MRERRQQRADFLPSQPDDTFTCDDCSKACRFRMLYTHSCNSTTNLNHCAEFRDRWTPTNLHLYLSRNLSVMLRSLRYVYVTLRYIRYVIIPLSHRAIVTYVTLV